MKKIIAASAVSMALLSGCSSTPKDIACNYYGDANLAAPEWICNPNQNMETYVRQAVGFSANDEAGVAHQKNLAMLQAQKDLGDQVKAEIISQIKSKTGTMGVDGKLGGTAATQAELNTVSNVTLEGVRVLRSAKGPDGYFYVHVGLPRQAIAQNVEKVVKAANSQSSIDANQKLAEQIAAAMAN
ncbi:LPP20 family lipoprotein [Paraferrimonas sp. SM1919]|uniref:LPP20 family lipoprotein n=1 Tax=Paraferrimonas sp. SM1919 TaxID=2662263 RepID=UPI0013D748B9|nr:LPP20 family lipoprotein [Paraferrimonas sp. SM1919]